MRQRFTPAGVSRVSSRASSDERLKADGKVLASEGGLNIDLDTHRGQKLRNQGSVDQYVVVSFVVSSPRTIFLKDEGRHLSYEPVRRRCREAAHDGPVIADEPEVR